MKSIKLCMSYLPRYVVITYIPKHSSRLIIHFTLDDFSSEFWNWNVKRDNKNRNMNTLTAANMLCTFVNQRQQVLCLVHNWIMNQGQDQGLQKEKWLTLLLASSKKLYPMYCKHLKEVSQHRHLGRQKLGWFLADFLVHQVKTDILIHNSPLIQPLFSR